MDIDFQDNGMLKAFGLVNKLLAAGIQVSWSVAPAKTLNLSASAPSISSVDFTASATDVLTGASITSHGYRGGPFIIRSADRDVAMPIVTAWIAANPRTAVHSASAEFAAPQARILVRAPSIAVLDTGNAPMLFAYLNGAGIPDANGQPWSPASPGVLLPASVAGSTASPRDGALFSVAGGPAYDQLLIPHWAVPRDATTTAVAAEIATFLTYRTHVFSSGAAALMVEDASQGHFLTTDNASGEPAAGVSCASATTPNNGLCVAPRPASLSFAHADLVFAQLDGPFATVGGSVAAYGLAPGSVYEDPGVVIARSAAATSDGVVDVWLTGYAIGTCQMAVSRTEAPGCAESGKVSYLGGFDYSVATPISANPTTQGVRLFLNSLLEAGSIAAP